MHPIAYIVDAGKESSLAKLLLYKEWMSTDDMFYVFATRLVCQVLMHFTTNIPSIEGWVDDSIGKDFRGVPDDYFRASGLAVMYFSVKSSTVSADWTGEVGSVYSHLVRRMFVRRFKNFRKFVLDKSSENETALPLNEAAHWLTAFPSGTDIARTVDDCVQLCELHPKCDYYEDQNRPARMLQGGAGMVSVLGVRVEKDWKDTHYGMIRFARQSFMRVMSKACHVARRTLFLSFAWLIRHVQMLRAKSMPTSQFTIEFSELPTALTNYVAPENGSRGGRGGGGGVDESSPFGNLSPTLDILNIPECSTPTATLGPSACNEKNDAALSDLLTKFKFFGITLKYTAKVVITEKDRRKYPEQTRTAPSTVPLTATANLYREAAIAMAASLGWDQKRLFSSQVLAFKAIFVVALGLRAAIIEALPDTLEIVSAVERIAKGNATFRVVGENDDGVSLMHNYTEITKSGRPKKKRRRTRGTGQSGSRGEGSQADGRDAVSEQGAEEEEPGEYLDIISDKLKISFEEYLKVKRRQSENGDGGNDACSTERSRRYSGAQDDDEDLDSLGDERFTGNARR